MKIISSKNAPEAIGPYSQAIQTDRYLFVSGQLPINPETGTEAGRDIEVQAHQVIRNIQAILKEAGYELTDVVKTTCFLKNMEDFATFNKVYGEYFGSMSGTQLRSSKGNSEKCALRDGSNCVQIGREKGFL